MPDLFAVIPVSDYGEAQAWYERLFGAPPTFEAHETECVWKISQAGYVAINEDPERAGRTSVTIFTEDLDATVDQIAERGIEAARRETYSNGARKVTYRDADGNEVGYGGATES